MKMIIFGTAGNISVGLDFEMLITTGTLSQHQDASTRVNGFTYAKALDEIEGILIEIVEPKLNKQSGKLKNATEYFQVRDPKLNDIENQVLLEEIELST